ncbi:MAG: metallopeptidase family protein [Lentisphaerota bacterium]
MKTRHPQPPSAEERHWYDIAERVVSDVRGALPDDLRAAADEVPVIIEERPGRVLRDAGLPDDLLGIFDAPAYADTLTDTDLRPPAIRLFIRNLRDEADDDPEVFREEVRVTYLHELGHLLGLDEDDLDARGLA